MDECCPITDSNYFWVSIKLSRAKVASMTQPSIIFASESSFKCSNECIWQDIRRAHTPRRSLWHTGFYWTGLRYPWAHLFFVQFEHHDHIYLCTIIVYPTCGVIVYILGHKGMDVFTYEYKNVQGVTDNNTCVCRWKYVCNDKNVEI